MKKQSTSNKNEAKKASLPTPDFTSPEINTDKTRRDNDADKTIKRSKSKKSKLEIDPDSTKIDTDADKTDRLNLPNNPSKQ